MNNRTRDFHLSLGAHTSVDEREDQVRRFFNDELGGQNVPSANKLPNSLDWRTSGTSDAQN